MKRREFIMLIGGGVARAQQPERVRRIGVLMAVAESHADVRSGVALFKNSLGQPARLIIRVAPFFEPSFRLSGNPLLGFGLGPKPAGRTLSGRSDALRAKFGIEWRFFAHVLATEH